MMHFVFATLDCSMTTPTTKISDGYIVLLERLNDFENLLIIQHQFRVFCIGFTRKQELSTKKTAYTQAGQVRV